MHSFILCVSEEYRLSLLTASSVNTGTAGVLFFSHLFALMHKYSKNVSKCKIGSTVLNVRAIDKTWGGGGIKLKRQELFIFPRSCKHRILKNL